MKTLLLASLVIISFSLTVPHCLIQHNIERTCYLCQTGYLLLNKNCDQCQQGYTWSHSECVKDSVRVSNTVSSAGASFSTTANPCKAMDVQTNICVECISGYQLVNHLCVAYSSAQSTAVTSSSGSQSGSSSGSGSTSSGSTTTTGGSTTSTTTSGSSSTSGN